MGGSSNTLYTACQNRDLKKAQRNLPRLLFDKINQVERSGRASFHAACYCNHPQIVQLLLESGAMRTTLSENESTPLHKAAIPQIEQLFR
jgi:ankyrin repeat protein